MGYVIMMSVIFMLVGLVFLIVIDHSREQSEKGKDRFEEAKIQTRPATWRNGMREIEMDASKYDDYAGALVEKYPMAMESLIRMEWLAEKMTEEEKRKVREEFEEKFDAVIVEEERKRRDEMKVEIEDVLEKAFKENQYVK
ncbi:hypothetical protein [Exiguobacterium oxidotolerans]|uniref:hypothetical protein n=1 Tax=Exiguobacterium oxidotolerans TaxID=223958 RepID=UPI000493CA10|nr:hypothetical protein [Exiguobacterium oxidotolerans]